MAEEKGPEQTLTDTEISEVKQPRRKFLVMGALAAGLLGTAMTTTSCGADHCDRDVTDIDPFDRPADHCDSDGT
jgi:hypothetical protein